MFRRPRQRDENLRPSSQLTPAGQVGMLEELSDAPSREDGVKFMYMQLSKHANVPGMFSSRDPPFVSRDSSSPERPAESTTQIMSVNHRLSE